VFVDRARSVELARRLLGGFSSHVRIKVRGGGKCATTPCGSCGKRAPPLPSSLVAALAELTLRNELKVPGLAIMLIQITLLLG
jgi:hypothetical protein